MLQECESLATFHYSVSVLLGSDQRLSDVKDQRCFTMFLRHLIVSSAIAVIVVATLRNAHCAKSC